MADVERGAQLKIRIIFFCLLAFSSLSLEARSPCFKLLPELKSLELVAIAQHGETNVFVSAVTLATRKGKILLGKRLTTENGTWAFAGGKMEANGEHLLRAAQREFFEETGLLIPLYRFRYYRRIDHPSKDGRFYASYLFLVELEVDEEPHLMEPDKTGEWSWFSRDNLPDPLFSSNQTLLKELGFWEEVENQPRKISRYLNGIFQTLKIAFH